MISKLANTTGEFPELYERLISQRMLGCLYCRYPTDLRELVYYGRNTESVRVVSGVLAASRVAVFGDVSQNRADVEELFRPQILRIRRGSPSHKTLYTNSRSTAPAAHYVIFNPIFVHKTVSF